VSTQPQARRRDRARLRAHEETRQLRIQQLRTAAAESRERQHAEEMDIERQKLEARQRARDERRSDAVVKDMERDVSRIRSHITKSDAEHQAFKESEAREASLMDEVRRLLGR